MPAHNEARVRKRAAEACTRYEADEAQPQLDADARTKCETTYQNLSAQGY